MPILREDLTSLIDHPETNEGPVQRFLEANPELVICGEHIEPNVVISQFRMGADHVADFAFIQPQSGRTFFYLVEIEDPRKPIFKTDKRGSLQFHGDFRSAVQQTDDWLTWCSYNHDALQALSRLLAEQYGVQEHLLIPRCILIYGRRSELQGSVVKQDRWQREKDKLHRAFVTLRTYDGFMEWSHFAFSMTRGQFYRPPVCVRYRARRFVPLRRS